ncbi:hypothetical protein Tco_0491540 [Tanacetum coccineum]
MEYCEDEDDSFTNLETEYPAIVFDDTSDAALSCEPRTSPLDNNEIDFKISFDEPDDEDYMVIFDENSFFCKIIYVDNLKTDSENENDKVNIPSSPSPEPAIGYINDLDLFKDFENEFPAIAYNDLKSKSDPLTEPSAPEKVTGVDLFYLRSMDRGTTNVLYLLAQYLFRHAERRKSGARLSGHHFIGRLAAHFRLVGDQGLRGLSVVASELPLINLHELRRLNICLRVGDTRAWVAPGPERQQAAAAGAPGAAKDAPAADKGAQAVPALMQAHKPSPPAPQHQTMT